jgi:hypothetical protein
MTLLRQISIYSLGENTYANIKASRTVIELLKNRVEPLLRKRSTLTEARFIAVPVSMEDRVGGGAPPPAGMEPLHPVLHPSEQRYKLNACSNLSVVELDEAIAHFKVAIIVAND